MALKALNNQADTVGPKKEDKMATFTEELGELINKWSKESGSDTPDFILADYMSGCLYVFNLAVRERDTWYSFKPSPLNALHPVTTATSSGPNANSGVQENAKAPHD